MYCNRNYYKALVTDYVELIFPRSYDYLKKKPQT